MVPRTGAFRRSQHPWGGASLAAKGLVAKDWCHAPGHLEGHSILGAAAGLAATGFAQGGHMVGKIVALHRGPKGGSKQGPCFPLQVVLIDCLSHGGTRWNTKTKIKIYEIAFYFNQTLPRPLCGRAMKAHGRSHIVCHWSTGVRMRC